MVVSVGPDSAGGGGWGIEAGITVTDMDSGDAGPEKDK